VAGVVSSSGIATRFDEVWGTRHESHVAWATYDYVVQGVAYRSDRIAFEAPASRDPAVAEAKVRQYPAGQAVSVFYDPSAPGTAILEPAVLTLDVAQLLVSLCLAAGAMFVAVVSAVAIVMELFGR
jgi:hypothetical protein